MPEDSFLERTGPAIERTQVLVRDTVHAFELLFKNRDGRFKIQLEDGVWDTLTDISPNGVDWRG